MIDLLTQPSATLVAAIIAALAAAASALLTYQGNRRARKDVTNTANYSRSFKQLNELYAPIIVRRALSKRLWTQLTGDRSATPGITKWRLIDHIKKIKAERDPSRREAVEQILALNKQMSELILTQGALLVKLPPPDSILMFLEHAATMETLWKLGVNADKVRDVPFPENLDSDLDAARIYIQAELDRAVSK